MKILARDNSYNSENDLSAEINFTIYGADEDCDWCWANDIYVALCVHRGGDVRGNYGATQIYKVDSLADTGFLDWTLGWNVEVLNTYHTEPGKPNFTRWDIDERKTEEASPGYRSLPSSYVSDLIGTDSVEWLDGKAYATDENGQQYRFTPYHYYAELDLPKDGSGWLCDASIDTESFLTKTLGEELETPDDVSESWDHQRTVESWITRQEMEV